MSVASRAENFTTFLLECVSKSDFQRGSFSYELNIDGESAAASATLLPPFVRCPLSEVTGPLPCPTVLLATPHRSRDGEEDESPEVKAILDQFSHSLLKDCREESEEDGVQESVVEFVEKEEIFVGSKLTRKRAYLEQQVPIHPGDSRGVLKQANLCRVVPLSLDLARALVSYYLVGARSKETGSLPALWVPCTPTEGAVEEDIVGLGCTHQSEAEDSVLRVYCVHKKRVGSGEAGAKRDGVRLTPADLQGDAFARYVIMSSEAVSADHGGGIWAEFTWENPESFLSPPPTFGTEGVLRIVADPGSLQATLSTFAELQALLGICEAVSEAREWWGDFSEEAEEGEEVLGRREEVLLVNKVDDFLQTINTPLSHTLQINVVSPSMENTVFQLRENLDFSENLWLFLKDALGAVFKAVLLRKVHNVTFRESSKSPLATLLRELLRCETDSDRQALAPKFQLLLSPARSLQCLAEIGVEKLRQDLRVCLTAARVASEGDVAGFLGDGEGDFLEQCHSLCNLFHVVDLVGTAMSHRCLPPASLAALARSAMKFYRERLPFVGFEATPLFSVALPRSSTVLRPVIDVCVGSGTLSQWSVSSKSMDKMRGVGLTGGGARAQGHVYDEVTCNEVRF